MAFDWEQYLTISQFLLGNRTDQNDKSVDRCVMSRAYYAAYNIAKLHLTPVEYSSYTQDLRERKGNSHILVWEYYRRVRGSGTGTIEDDGLMLKNWRVDADYHEQHHISPRNAVRAVGTARRIIDDIKRIRSN